jgi:predicted Rossmann fold nucleotide-binding protein DprA/Smf involved in DNA uptake
MMKWVGISGSWRYSAPGLEKDVRREVAKVIKLGDGIVTGGAHGVDYIATETVIQLNKSLNHLRIFLPTDLPTYLAHYHEQARKGLITASDVSKLDKQLIYVQDTRPKALIEGRTGLTVNESTYLARNKKIAASAEALIAFQVNNSVGTQQTIDHARKLGKTVTHFTYVV